MRRLDRSRLCQFNFQLVIKCPFDGTQCALLPRLWARLQFGWARPCRALSTTRHCTDLLAGEWSKCRRPRADISLATNFGTTLADDVQEQGLSKLPNDTGFFTLLHFTSYSSSIAQLSLSISLTFALLALPYHSLGCIEENLNEIVGTRISGAESKDKYWGRVKIVFFQFIDEKEIRAILMQ